MADINVVLTLKGGSSSGTSSQKAEENSKKVSENTVRRELENEYDEGNSKALGAMAAKQLLSTVVNEGWSWATYEWQKNATLSDDYISQRNASIASTMVGKIGGAVNTIASSAIAGAAFGPVGAIVGAALGTISAGASLTRQYFQAIEQQDIMLKQMDASLQNTRNKVGWSTVAASIGEDL